MMINFNIAKKFVQPFITINAAEKNSEIENLAQSIDRLTDGWQIQGVIDGRKTMLSVYQIISFHTAGKDVVCQTEDLEYKVNQRIYELIQTLPKNQFVQISSSEIINVSSIKDLTLTKTGSYQINLNNGQTTYTSRRYMKLLRKEFLK